MKKNGWKEKQWRQGIDENKSKREMNKMKTDKTKERRQIRREKKERLGAGRGRKNKRYKEGNSTEEANKKGRSFSYDNE